MGTYTYDDGYIQNYTFYGTYYPITPNLNSNMSISYFYDIDTEQFTDYYFSSGSPPWITDMTVTVSDSTVLSGGGNQGPNNKTNPVQVENFGGTYGTIGGNIEHYYSIDVQVNLTGVPPPSPPNPPNTPVNAEYRIGTGPWTSFPGFPTNMAADPSGSVQGLNIPNGDTLYVQVY
jgi:hypothetical protein